MDGNNFEGLSKRERKDLKKKLRKERIENEIKSKDDRKRNKKIIKIGIVVLILSIIGFFLIQGAENNAPDPRGPGSIKISLKTYDFGNVSVAKGTVSTSMEITNTGKGRLLLKGLKSSCMCTTAVIVKDGVESPVFGMHNNAYWKDSIEPGEKVQLKIYYDPTAHPELRGAVTRTLTIYSDDPTKPEETVRINVNQVT